MYAIYGNIYHEYTPVMLAYIPYIRILWVGGLLVFLFDLLPSLECRVKTWLFPRVSPSWSCLRIYKVPLNSLCDHSFLIWTEIWDKYPIFRRSSVYVYIYIYTYTYIYTCKVHTYQSYWAIFQVLMHSISYSIGICCLYAHYHEYLGISHYISIISNRDIYIHIDHGISGAISPWYPHGTPHFAITPRRRGGTNDAFDSPGGSGANRDTPGYAWLTGSISMDINDVKWCKMT